MASLTDDDARPDGFATADALRTELTTLYADQLAAGHRAYRICFELLSSEEQAAAVAQRKAAKAARQVSLLAAAVRPTRQEAARCKPFCRNNLSRCRNNAVYLNCPARARAFRKISPRR